MIPRCILTIWFTELSLQKIFFVQLIIMPYTVFELPEMELLPHKNFYLAYNHL
jgi:hypothetical protein